MGKGLRERSQTRNNEKYCHLIVASVGDIFESRTGLWSLKRGN